MCSNLECPKSCVRKGRELLNETGDKEGGPVSAPFSPGPKYCFSVFEVDSRVGELRRNGVRQRIQDQPFQVLLKLLAQPRQIVTREELKAALWPSDTFVDFDNGLNMAVMRLREALADDADRPIFIETVPRRGTGSSLQSKTRQKLGSRNSCRLPIGRFGAHR